MLAVRRGRGQAATTASRLLAAWKGEVHYKDGAWVSAEELTLSTQDITFLRGYGVFDFLRTYDRRPFTTEDHIQRLFSSAQMMDIHPPEHITPRHVEQIIAEGIKRNPHLPDLYIKLYLTGGVANDAITIGKPSLIAMFLPAGSYPPEDYKSGIKLITMPYERFLPRAKSLNYMAAVMGVNQARQKGAKDALFVTNDNKYILEGTTQNFFGVKDSILYTPKDGILHGITRKVVLQLAQKHSLEVIVGHVPTSFFSQFQEAFITSTTREVTPVAKIDEQVIGQGHPGPVTQNLMKAFKTVTHHL